MDNKLDNDTIVEVLQNASEERIALIQISTLIEEYAVENDELKEWGCGNKLLDELVNDVEKIIKGVFGD